MKFEWKYLFLGASFVGASTSFAAGYEKAILWSGKYSGIGGAATSVVHGSESIYFNPAGISTLEGGDVSVNFSPTFPKFKGPVISNDADVDGKRTFLPIPGITAGYTVIPNLSVGVGFYSAGGSNSKFEGVDPSTVSTEFNMGAQTSEVDLKVLETALGAAYKITPNWSVGAAWRVAIVRADFSIFSPHPLSPAAAAAYLQLSNLKQTKWNGFKIGTQYRADDNSWGLGLNFRSAIKFALKGDVGGKIDTPAPTGTPPADITSTTGATVKNTFPLQVSLGGDYAINNSWRLFSEYVFTQYSKNKQIVIDGDMSFNFGAGATTVPISDLDQHWYDMHMIRLATEYTGIENWAFRAGYNLVSQVVPKWQAKANFAAPGIGHTFALGAGTSFLDKKLDVDAGLEYSFANAKIKAGEGVQGKHHVDAYALHLGSTYRF